MKRIIVFPLVFAGLLALSACYQYASDNSAGSDSENPNGLIMENARVCVQSRSSLGWSQPYIGEVSVMKGWYLNGQEQYTGYESGSDYAILQGGDDTPIKLQRFHGSFTEQGVYGEDFRGRAWRFSSPYSCN